jgi:hypothetical protein
MKDYTTVGGQLKRGLAKFVEKICEGVGRVGVKFIGSMLYGLLKGQSVLLTEIGRALEEEIALKKTVDRLARNLKRFEQAGTLTENYISIVKESIDEETIFILDPGEISKEYSRKQEKLCKVWDASKKRSVNGYKLVEITALTHGTKLPIPVYTKLHSTKEDEVEKQSAENISALKYLDEQFGNIGIRIMDRGMDDINIYKQSAKSKYIVRAKSNRNVIYNGETVNILELANRFKGKISLKHTDKYGKNHNLKIWHVDVKLPELSGQPMTLIMVHGYEKKDPEPCLLLTNMDANGKQKSLQVLKVYLCRWRIEEYYRFKKVQFDLENVRVMSLAAVRTMNLLVSMLTGWLSLMAAKRGESVLLDRIFAYARRVYAIPQFTLYAVADGIFRILAKSSSGIAVLLSPPPRQNTTRKHSPSPHPTAFGRRFFA